MNKLSNVIIGSVLVTISIVLILLYWPQKHTNVFLSQAHYDFGTVSQTEELKGSFKIVNPTSKRVKIVDLKSNCGCTIPKLDKTSLEAKEQSTVNFILRLDATRGAIVKRINVLYSYTDIPKKIYNLSFTVSANVAHDYEINPITLKVQEGIASTHQIKLTPRIDLTVSPKLEKIVSNSPAFSNSIVNNSTGDSTEALIHFDPTKLVPESTLPIYLLIHISNTKQNYFRIPIKVQQQFSENSQPSRQLAQER